MTGTHAPASRRWRWAGRSSAPITATTACSRRSDTRRVRRSPKATRWSRATGRCSRSSRSGRPSGATMAPSGARRGSPDMADNDRVDVLIIGSGASGAAVAWSLAETKMRILCLEQGDWMKQSEYPSTGRDWEAKFYGEWSTSPNIRGRKEDYPINDDNSPIKVVRSEEHTSELTSH